MADAGGRTIRYRPEIDGLRAIAVLAVILDHAGLSWLRGGLLGVDLFFVVSGYLITGILVADLAEGRFSIARFYERRVRRIIPALMLVMLVCIPLAFWLMLPDSLENFGQSLVGTTLFANNIVLLLTSGYFEQEVMFKPLLHTWSLGVEEQYYFIAPLALWAAWRMGKAKGVLIGVAALTLLSFVAALGLGYVWPNANFLLIVSRGWELGAGSLAVLVEPRLRALARPPIAAALALTGLALATIPLFLPTAPSGPGLATLVPVAGACIILLYGSANGPAGRLLASPAFVGIGLISYSAYLIHQPVFAFTRIVSLAPPPSWLMLALIPPILLAAWASWRWVEQPFRAPARIPTRTVLLASSAAALVTLAAGLTFHVTSGFYARWPELADTQSRSGDANIAYNLGPDRFAMVRLPERSDKVRVLVLGDSFGRDFINMALETGRMDHHLISLTGFEECIPFFPGKMARALPADFIVIATRFDADQAPCLVTRIAELRANTSVPIIVIGPKSFGYNNEAIMLLPRDQRLTWHTQPVAETVAANDAARHLLPPGTYVDIIALLGDPQGRVPVFTPAGKFISQDRQHFTRAGAAYAAAIVFRHPALQALLNARPRVTH